MADLSEVYEEARRAISDVVSGLDEDGLSTMVPACPDWNVRDVVVHLKEVAAGSLGSGVPDNFLSAWNDEGARSALNEWTRGHVEAGRAVPLEETLAEWDKAAARLVPMMRGDEAFPASAPPFADWIITTDVSAHLHDIYGALGIVRDRDAAPVKIGMRSYIQGIALRLQMSGAPAVAFAADGKEWVAGDGEPVAKVSGSRFELFRALSGRRSPDQIKALDWTGDPEPFVELFYPYGVRTEPLVE